MWSHYVKWKCKSFRVELKKIKLNLLLQLYLAHRTTVAKSLKKLLIVSLSTVTEMWCVKQAGKTKCKNKIVGAKDNEKLVYVW